MKWCGNVELFTSGLHASSQSVSFSILSTIDHKLAILDLTKMPTPDEVKHLGKDAGIILTGLMYRINLSHKMHQSYYIALWNIGLINTILISTMTFYHIQIVNYQ